MRGNPRAGQPHGLTRAAAASLSSIGVDSCIARPLVNRLLDRVCLVTGSTGMAAASARRLAAEGAAVFVVSRTAGHASALADEIAMAGGDATGLEAELADEAAVERAVAECID